MRNGAERSPQPLGGEEAFMGAPLKKLVRR